MIKKKYIIPPIISFSLSLIIGALNNTTNSLIELFFTKEYYIALIVYTLLFLAVYYTGIWYIKAQKNYA